MTTFECKPPPTSSAHQTTGNGAKFCPRTHAKTDDNLNELATIGNKLRIARNQTIFAEGEAVDFAYKIVSGVVRLCKHLPNGRRQIAQFLFPDDYLSFIALADHSFSAEAVTDVVVMSFPYTQIELLCRKNPELRSRLFDMLSGRVRDIQNHLTMVGRQTAKERIAFFLLMMFERQGLDDKGSDRKSMELSMSRHDIADYLSLTTETVSRIIGRLKSKRIIEIHSDQRRLEIVNINALKSLASSAE